MLISELNFEDIFKVVEPDFSCLVTVYDNDEGKNFVSALLNHYRPIYIGKSKWPVMGENEARFWNGLQVHESIKDGLAHLVNNSVVKGSLIFINEDTLESSSLNDVLKMISDYKVFFVCRFDRSVKNTVNLRTAGKMREFVSSSIVLYPDSLMGYSTIDVVNLKSGKEIDRKSFKLDNLKVRILADKLFVPLVEESNSKHDLLQRLACKADNDRNSLQSLNEIIKRMLNRSIGIPFVMKELSCSEDQARRLVRRFKENL